MLLLVLSVLLVLIVTNPKAHFGQKSLKCNPMNHTKAYTRTINRYTTKIVVKH